MTGLSSMLQHLSSLSPRERRLIGFAVSLAALVGLIYGVLMPGLAAARSAESRRDTAAAELATARQLAAIARSPEAQADAGSLEGAAREAGFTVVAAQGGTLRLQAQGPATVLAWLGNPDHGVRFDSVVMSAASTGGITADIRTGEPQ
jgi:type II secretory pathway component PulM